MPCRSGACIRCTRLHSITTCGDCALQAKNIGDLAVYELRSAFARVKGKLIKRLLLTKTYRVVANGLNIGAAVPSSAYSIFATSTDSRGVTKVHCFHVLQGRAWTQCRA
jgi:hypothetical protein